MIKSERLTTLGFGIPNLFKSGEVGYFPEQFIVDMGLQGKTALEIKRFFMSYNFDFDIDGDVIHRMYDNTKYFVDLKHNVFIKYYDIEQERFRTVVVGTPRRLNDDTEV